MLRTKLPASLDKREIRVVDKERHSAVQELRLGLEVGIENSHVVAHAHIRMLHALSQRSGFVPFSVGASLILNIDAFTGPSLAFHLHEFL